MLEKFIKMRLRGMKFLYNVNLSVCLRQPAPLPRGASGEEIKFSDMPRPPLVRSNNDDRRQRRKQGVAVGAAASRMQATAKQTLGAATRAVARRRRDGEVESSSGSRSGCPSYNLSVCFADSSPSRGASGEEADFSDMPKPPLDRGGGIAQR